MPASPLTDALHILGELDKWDAAASRAGARLLALDRTMAPEALAEAVRDLAVHKIAFQVFRKGMSMQGRNMKEEGELEKLIWDALAEFDAPKPGPRVLLELNAALIGVGAPAWAFMGQAGRLMQEKTIMPEGAEVAGAVGAAVGSFSLNYAVLINPMPTGEFRVHHPLGMRDYEDLETAVEETRRSMLPWIIDRAKRAGAVDPQVEFDRLMDAAMHDSEKQAGIGGLISTVGMGTSSQRALTQVSNDYTTTILFNEGVFWPVITEEYLASFFDYLTGLSFWGK